MPQPPLPQQQPPFTIPILPLRSNTILGLDATPAVNMLPEQQLLVDWLSKHGLSFTVTQRFLRHVVREQWCSREAIPFAHLQTVLERKTARRLGLSEEQAMTLHSTVMRVPLEEWLQRIGFQQHAAILFPPLYQMALDQESAAGDSFNGELCPLNLYVEDLGLPRMLSLGIPHIKGPGRARNKY